MSPKNPPEKAPSFTERRANVLRDFRPRDLTNRPGLALLLVLVGLPMALLLTICGFAAAIGVMGARLFVFVLEAVSDGFVLLAARCVLAREFPTLDVDLAAMEAERADAAAAKVPAASGAGA